MTRQSLEVVPRPAVYYEVPLWWAGLGILLLAIGGLAYWQYRRRKRRGSVSENNGAA